MIKLAAMLLTHRSYSRGRDNLIDADLSQFAEAYPDLRPVLEETQFLRHEAERLERQVDVLTEQKRVLKD
jgi:hypothetical protein